ncbi:MAPEG family protein [Sulfitobacter sp. S190]|uniref:MAPEG family protein n=1 Tax=Sulfitobacter sp. S190 TaxID=2867022 RepID=UPI0021A92C21|nr:MAPEG family protein [Sulfitobacter sp. S190]UWR21701.1 MAPEG family protein [Sulfitobacter sp. S190]
MTEPQALIAYALLVLLTIVWQATGALGQFGITYLMSARDEGRVATGVSGRVERAMGNSITAMVLFAPAVLLIVALDASTPASRLAAIAFLIARIVYLPAYAFGIKGLRSLAWTVGFVATVSLYLVAL